MRSGANNIRQMLHTTRTRKCSLRSLQSLETVRLLPELLAFVIMKVLAVVVFVLMQSAIPVACPLNCKCTKYKILCRDSRLRSLPQGLPTTKLVSMKGDVLVTLDETVVSKGRLGNLLTLKLVETNIKVIKSHAFVSMGKLESLNISENNIWVIIAGAFAGLDKLINLDLSNNKLRYIRRGVFEGLDRLRYLQLARNHIGKIHYNMFDGLRRDCGSGVVHSLRTIDLSDNEIWKVEDGAFRGLCSLNSLIIHFCRKWGCKPTSPSGHFNPISSLRRLEIISSVYPLKILNMTMRGLVNFNHLDIDGTYLPKLKNRFLEDSKLLSKLFIVRSRVQELELGCFQGLQSLSELNLSGNELISLPKGVFLDLPSLQKLDLSTNNIAVIKRHLFKGPSRLRILVLTKNPISTIEGNAFSNLPYLRELLLYSSIIPNFHDPYDYQESSGTVIERIDSDAFEGLFSIKSLQLPFCSQQNSTNVTLQSLDRLDNFQGPEHFVIDNFQVAKNLTFLISGHLIPSNINKWFREVMHLKLPVSMEMLGLKSLAGLKFISGFHIKSLFLINCESCVIGNNTFVGFSQLQSLTLYTAVSKIQIVQGAFSGLKNLRNLQLCSTTGFNFAAGVFQELGMLKKLVLIGTYSEPSQIFVPITNELKWFIDIRELVLVYLGIQRLGESKFLELGSLEKLEITRNIMYQLNRAQLRGLRNLKILNLRDNQISILSVGSFEGLTNIEKINLEGNSVQNISAGVFGAICSDNFTLTCGNLTQLHKYCNTSFALETLIKLNLNRNRMEYINKHAFLGCNNLQELDLWGNNIQTIDFLFIPNLTTFHVRSNISAITNDTFRCTPMLTDIEVSTSNILSMKINAVNYLKNLKHISLFNMYLDCNLHELWLYLRSRDITYRYTYGYLRTSIDDTLADIDNRLSKLECNASTNDTTQNKNESSTANEYMYFKMYIEPIVFIFIFLSGCFGNGLLLFIVLRHSDMRNRKNACVAHLAIADILSLVLNLPLSYWDVLHVNWDLGETTCKIFITSKDLVVALVVFSVVALTFERYLVVQIFNKLNSPYSNSARPIVFLVIVWLYALICSIPSYFHATVEGRCLSSLPGRHGYLQRQWTFQLLMNCILPVAAIVSLNILSAYTLKKSISQILGEIRNQSRDASRNTVANVVMVLSLVFTLSSLPNFLLRTLVSWSVWTYEEVFWYSFVTYCLYFLHTIFNPFALFVMGSKYKSHIKDYVNFFIREREHVPTSPDVNRELESACDVLQNFGQRFAGTHQAEDVEEPDDIVARDEEVRRARQERLKKLQGKFKM